MGKDMIFTLERRVNGKRNYNQIVFTAVRDNFLSGYFYTLKEVTDIVYTVDRNPTKKKAGNGKYRKSTVH